VTDWIGVDVSNTSASAAERFWAKVQKSDSCWLWIGAKSKNGYGNFKARSYVNVPAHRWSYEMARGDIPEGLHLDHLCRTPLCVNPAHLEAVPQGINTLRGNGFSGTNARKTHCVKGHDLARAYVNRDGQRKCRECHAQTERARRAMKPTRGFASTEAVR
jgi:hypothetical protein